MAIKTISSREFNQGASEAKRAASHGPVFITDRGRPAHVLMSIEHYQSLTAAQENIADLLAMPDVAGAEVDLDISRARDLARPADFS